MSFPSGIVTTVPTSTSPMSRGVLGVIGVYLRYVVGSVGRGVQWDAVTEYHVVPVHHAMCKYTIIHSSTMSHRLNTVSH